MYGQILFFKCSISVVSKEMLILSNEIPFFFTNQDSKVVRFWVVVDGCLFAGFLVCFKFIYIILY